jgi:hypothetical protein
MKENQIGREFTSNFAPTKPTEKKIKTFDN